MKEEGGQSSEQGSRQQHDRVDSVPSSSGDANAVAARGEAVVVPNEVQSNDKAVEANPSVEGGNRNDEERTDEGLFCVNHAGVFFFCDFFGEIADELGDNTGGQKQRLATTSRGIR